MKENDREVGGRRSGGRVVFWVGWERVLSWERHPGKAALKIISAEPWITRRNQILAKNIPLKENTTHKGTAERTSLAYSRHKQEFHVGTQQGRGSERQAGTRSFNGLANGFNFIVNEMRNNGG